MKFEDKIKEISSSLQEDLMNPIAGAQAGNPTAANPAQIAGQAQQQPQAQQQAQTGQPQQGGDVDANQALIAAIDIDANDPDIKALDRNDPNFFQTAMGVLLQKQQAGQPNAQVNPSAPSNNTQTTSAQPASVNTSGQQGATSVAM